MRIALNLPMRDRHLFCNVEPPDMGLVSCLLVGTIRSKLSQFASFGPQCTDGKLSKFKIDFQSFTNKDRKT
jgi:hypothetical protein